MPNISARKLQIPISFIALSHVKFHFMIFVRTSYCLLAQPARLAHPLFMVSLYLFLFLIVALRFICHITCSHRRPRSRDRHSRRSRSRDRRRRSSKDRRPKSRSPHGSRRRRSSPKQPDKQKSRSNSPALKLNGSESLEQVK